MFHLVNQCELLLFFQVDDIERDATVVKELYDLIETYKVPTPPEDLAVYQVLVLSVELRFKVANRTVV